MQESDCNKTGFLIPNGQQIYLRIEQSLIKAISTYFLFSDIVFRLRLPIDKMLRMRTIIDIKKNAFFCLYKDDHRSSTRSFQDMFLFLYETYFARLMFQLVYLTGKKTYAFDEKLIILRFERTSTEIRLSLKHSDEVKIEVLLKVAKNWTSFFGWRFYSVYLF